METLQSLFAKSTLVLIEKKIHFPYSECGQCSTNKELHAVFTAIPWLVH